MHTFAHILDHRCLARCCSVSRYWNNLAGKDSLWKALCVQLWSDKAHVAERFRLLLGGGRSREAMKESLHDAKRSWIMLEEFLGLTFHFRFKEAAGQFWTDMDPFWPKRQSFVHALQARRPHSRLPPDEVASLRIVRGAWLLHLRNARRYLRGDLRGVRLRLRLGCRGTATGVSSSRSPVVRSCLLAALATS